MLSLRINDKSYPTVNAPVEYMTGCDWVSSILPRVTRETAQQIDQNHLPGWPGFIVDTIYFAMIDGWSSSGTIFEDDEEIQPIHWAIEHDGKPIGRDDLEELLNPAEVQ